MAAADPIDQIWMATGEGLIRSQPKLGQDHDWCGRLVGDGKVGVNRDTVPAREELPIG